MVSMSKMSWINFKVILCNFVSYCPTRRNDLSIFQAKALVKRLRHPKSVYMIYKESGGYTALQTSSDTSGTVNSKCFGMLSRPKTLLPRRETYLDSTFRRLSRYIMQNCQPSYLTTYKSGVSGCHACFRHGIILISDNNG